MTTSDKLKLLAKASKYEIDQADDKKGYMIFCKNEPIVASMQDDGRTDYYLTDCYNSLEDWHKINVEALIELIEFCKLLKGE